MVSSTRTLCLIVSLLCCILQFAELKPQHRRYKLRRILPPVPGHVPVYIQHGGSPPDLKAIYRLASSLRHKTEKSAPIDRFYKTSETSKNKMKPHHPNSWSSYRGSRPKIVRTYKLAAKPKAYHLKS